MLLSLPNLLLKRAVTPVAKKKSSVKIAPLGNNQYRISGLKNNRKLEVKAGDIRTNAYYFSKRCYAME